MIRKKKYEQKKSKVNDTPAGASLPCRQTGAHSRAKNLLK